MEPLLRVENLRVSYASRGASCAALAGVTFDLHPAEILGVLGESGSGKSTLASAIPKLLPANGFIEGGRVVFEGQNLLQLSPRSLQRIRGNRLGLVLQEPSSSLHPTIRIDTQVSAVIAAHQTLHRSALRAAAHQVLETVFGADTDRISRSYPHELSGGQRQRVLLAQAVACRPSLLIADEPTASLDPCTQGEILRLFGQIRTDFGLSIILITHHPLLLAGLADRILVLYAGRIAEIGPTEKILAAPQHPYAEGLLHCLPSLRISEDNSDSRLTLIPGQPPDLSLHVPGCRFEPRCSERMQICASTEPEAIAVDSSHSVSCFKFSA